MNENANHNNARDDDLNDDVTENEDENGKAMEA